MLRDALNAIQVFSKKCLPGHITLLEGVVTHKLTQQLLGNFLFSFILTLIGVHQLFMKLTLKEAMLLSFFQKFGSSQISASAS